MTDKTKGFDELADRAMDRLRSFFADEEGNPQELASARIAATVLSSWTRHKQTEGSRDAVTFMMARELARDKEQLESYVRVALPNSPLVRMLPVPGQLVAAK